MATLESSSAVLIWPLASMSLSFSICKVDPCTQSITNPTVGRGMSLALNLTIQQDLDSQQQKTVARLSEMQWRFLPMDENGRKECYYAARETFNRLALSEENAVEKAALFIFLNKTCFNGLYRVNRKGQFNVPMGAYKNPCICDEDNLRNVSNALQNVEIVCGDYSLSSRVIDEKTFVYLDPPYRPISETSAFTSYNTDAFDDNEQIRLARFIDEMNRSGAKIVLSNSDPQNVDEGDKRTVKTWI